MRTEEQKQAFVMECLEIEKAGGDVLGYIEVNWPSYTPRGTWYNLQKRYLNRNTAHLTEGRPEVPKGDEKEMQRRNRMKILDGMIAAIEKGSHPYDYLEEQGYMVPMQAYADLKKWAKANAPEKAEILPVNLKGLKLNRQKIPRVKDKPAPELKAGEALPVKLPEKTGDHVSAEEFRKTVEFNGKEYERMNKASPTCCQPARPSGVTAPDDGVIDVSVPLKRRLPLKVCGVQGTFGTFELSQIPNSPPVMFYVWRDLMTHEEKSIYFDPQNWLIMCDEIQMALKQLGLTK